MRVHGTLLLSFMFEKWTKKVASKATDSAIEGAAQTLNDRIGQYGDIIQIGLVLGVIILGSRHLTRKTTRNHAEQTYIPANLPSGQPIIVNNYYREREEYSHERSKRGNSYIQNGELQGTPYQTRQTRSKR